MSVPLRHRGALRRWELRFGPNMTPMVDVTLVILIFYMAATAFLGQEWFLHAAIPSFGKGAVAADPFALPPARFEITLARSGDGRTIATGMGLEGADLDALAERIASTASGQAGEAMIVILRPDPRVPYRDVVRVHDACAAAGVGTIALAPPEK